MQHITIKVQDTILNKDFFVTLVYAKCDGVQRRALWEDIYQLHNSMSLPWIIGGDFNVVLNAEEKLGGLVVQPADVDDFSNCIGDCDSQKCLLEVVLSHGGMVELQKTVFLKGWIEC